MFKDMLSGLAKATTDSCWFKLSREIEKSLSYQEFELFRVKWYRKSSQGKWKLLQVSGSSSYRGLELLGVDCIALNECYLVPRTSYQKVGSSKKILLAPFPNPRGKVKK